MALRNFLITMVLILDADIIDHIDIIIVTIGRIYAIIHNPIRCQ